MVVVVDFGFAVVTVVVLAGCIWQYGHRQHLPLLQALTPNGYLSASTVVAATCLFLAAVGAGARVTPAPWLANLLERLSDASFGVFLVHLLILEAIRMSVPAVARASSLWVLVAAYAVVLVSSFLVSIGASRVPYLRTVF